MTEELTGALILGILINQLPAVAILLSRLIKGPSRKPPIEPQSATLDMLGSVSIVVPTLNEAKRIGPCLAGLSRQSYEVREIIVVDSRSQDGTQELVKAAGQKDPRFRLIEDEPLPAGWVGRPWALHSGFLYSSEKSEWILGIDADTQPHPGLVAGLLARASREQYDLISLSPQFILKYAGELWLQPALLLTLVYRFGPSGTKAECPERVMANGQCFLCRRSVLVQMGGYTSAGNSFCDDVTLARSVAAAGFKVGFLDGAKVLKVRMYEGALETWREWGRSLDLKDASSQAQVWGDLWLLLAIQGLPLPIVFCFLLFSLPLSSLSVCLLGLNLFLVAIRFALNFALAPAYDRTQAKKPWIFWLSPFADPLAVLRIFLSAVSTPKQWRGRTYGLPPTINRTLRF
ncbi:MAG: glycosyltransferase [Oscillatoriaceae bacterium SKW80]|nr:glycosyltransferase [Oscillatoriaceae bacterium SKYG93]MCX8121371.1 glycosyltransferase [Oscillatoriaceae bacterium SKW80]MDW8451952.1 glycosyltransferase family 2 protein [Oscillatoriaceae cyanobacterium SKYGB_i_bin93]HIK29495.1 glycosyltransferase [Oscillatoriaceae cyanobacterium M7585_C2015_266]